METCHVRGGAGVRHAPRYEPIGAETERPRCEAGYKDARTGHGETGQR